MKTFLQLSVYFTALLFVTISVIAQESELTAIKGYPFPTGLTSSSSGSKIAWAFDMQGKRNVFVAEGPDFSPRQVTNYDKDDGQEITSLSISADGNWLVFVRGGDHGSNWGDDDPVNPEFRPFPDKVAIYAVRFEGGEPRMIAEADYPVISPKSDMIVFLRNNQVWSASLLDTESKPESLFQTRGRVGSLEWSPDGSKLAFVAFRGDHSFIGVYTNSETPIQWISPSFNRDSNPGWSPDGSRLVFVRRPGGGGTPDSILVRNIRPWEIWTADINSGEASLLWKSPNTPEGSTPTTHGGYNLRWAANNRITFLSYMDGWPHLYSINSSGDNLILLTPGNFMAEHISLSPDGRWLVFSANTGPDKLDLDRRHAARVAVDKPGVEILVAGNGLEWAPVITGDGNTIAMISATAQRPPLPAVMPANKGKLKLLSENLISNYPTNKLVTPTQITFQSVDGLTIHGQMFTPEGGLAKKPAIIYVHGGPPRQMLLGWHYSDYYSNAYAYNQYLCSRGFIVITVNYRLGIGYGYKFHQADNAGSAGASEYKDIKAAGEWLSRQSFVDASKIGIYGGSYGGYLTAMALGRDSQLFAAGVDIHGVHDRTVNRTLNLIMPDSYERAPDADLASKIAWESSPVSDVKTWTSPVLIIHADDDRNVQFSQSTDLVQRLHAKGVYVETLVVVDDTHHWMKFSNALKVGEETLAFFRKQLMK
jgi:dipeptidyl aminopeptidase/acylaminoacyl peptidase